MSRKTELNEVKNLIKKFYDDADCGLYDTRNLTGDRMMTIFKGEYFTLKMCYYYSYFEVFGTTDKEFELLKKYYNRLNDVAE